MPMQCVGNSLLADAGALFERSGCVCIYIYTHVWGFVCVDIYLVEKDGLLQL